MEQNVMAWVPDLSAPPQIRLAEVELPRLAPGHVLIRVQAFSVNRGETFLLENPPADWRPGKDVAGEVIAVGSDVSELHPGQRVVAHAEQAGWAEAVAVEADRVALLPNGISAAQAAAIPLAGLTALRLTRASGPLAARRILMTGASGGVGHAFVQFAAAHGARVTVVCRSRERGARLLEFGAEAVVGSVEDAGGPFDIALESTGGAVLAAALERLTPDGRLVWFGQASRHRPVLDFFNWAGGRSATLRKFHYLDDETPLSTDLQALVRIVAGKRLQIEVGSVEDWAQTPRIIAALLGRQIRGKAVLTIDPARVPKTKTAA
ncbi:MAG TPA: zinc-binding dehydrogenase [Rhizomicrobium sp.]|nr:zinc-binding dehydrogenase [Rhizomicrobium sp.]